MRNCRIFLILLFTAVCTIASERAAAETNEDLELCAGPAENPAIRVANCSIAIRLGTLSGADLGAAHYNRGQAYFAQGKSQEALADFEKALDFAPDHPEVLVNRAAANRKLGNYKAAVEDYDRLLNEGYEPAFSIYFNRGIAYHYMGDEKSALRDMRKARDLNPDDSYIAETLDKTERLYKFR